MAQQAPVVAPLRGQEQPRLAPPLPARSRLEEYVQAADDLGIELAPWQRRAARYLMAQGAGADSWLYRHVAIVVARQNGKTTLLLPLIVQRLRMGQRIMHTAQDRTLPRDLYRQVAEFFIARPAELEVSGGRIRMPRWANGQEEVRLKNGGVYSIVSPSRGGARGPARDLVIVDELRELHDYEFIAAATPTLTASRSPQMVYCSNAGDEESVVLNGLRASRDQDPALAYLEWSADESHAVDDPAGWAQANPGLGHLPGIEESLRSDLQTHRARGTIAIFETENLCRWVLTMRERFVDEFAWAAGRMEEVGRPHAPSLAVAMDPGGRRASVAMAWQLPDGQIALRLLGDAAGSPVDLAAVGQLVRAEAGRHAARVGYDPVTDAELAKFAPKGKGVSIAGAQYANACAQFVNVVNARGLRWAPDAEPIGADLTWTARKPDGEPGHFHAVRAHDDHPVTAALAAIRAVWLASGPAVAAPRVY